MVPTFLAVLALAAPPQVAVVDDLPLEDAARTGAVGLVVPDAGPRTSAARARASLACGAVVNSLREEGPACAAPIPLDAADPEVVVELPTGGEQRNDRRYPIALRGASGLLTSDATRIPGLVSVADVASGDLETVPHGDPVAYLRALDERIRETGRARLPAFLVSLAVLAALALVRARAAVLGFATLLAGNLLLGALGVSEPWVVVLALAASAAAGAGVPVRAPTAVGGVLAAVLVAYLAVLGVQHEWVSLSPLGPSQNARFFGVSNLLETLLLVPAFAAAALLRRPAALLGVAAVAVVAVAGGAFGADGGGAVVLLAGYAVLALALHGAFPGGALLLATLAVAVAAIWLGPETHVTRAAGGDALGDRVALSLERLADDPLAAAVAAAAVLALGLLVLLGRRRRVALALAVAVAVSLVVNDSPFEVALGGLVGYLALDRYDSAG